MTSATRWAGPGGKGAGPPRCHSAPRPAPHVLGLVGGGATELSLKPCARPPQVAALGRSLAHERGRSLAEGGALRALEIAVGGAKARVGGAFRARDRAWERLRQQQVGGVSAGGVARRRGGACEEGAWPNAAPPTQEAGRGLWAELEAARAAREGAELRAQEAESQCREKEAELQRLRQVGVATGVRGAWLRESGRGYLTGGRGLLAGGGAGLSGRGGGAKRKGGGALRGGRVHRGPARRQWQQPSVPGGGRSRSGMTSPPTCPAHPHPRECPHLPFGPPPTPHPPHTALQRLPSVGRPRLTAPILRPSSPYTPPVPHPL